MRGERRHIIAVQRAKPLTLGDGSDSESVEILDSDDPVAQCANQRAKRFMKAGKRHVHREGTPSDKSDVEVLESPLSHIKQSTRKCPIKCEPEDDITQLLKRPRYDLRACSMSSDIISIVSSSEHSASTEPPSPQQQQLPFPSPCPSSGADMSVITVRPIASTQGRWPEGWYSIDILKGFAQMEEMSDEVPNIKERFESIFQVPWQNHAYYDTRRRLTKLRQCDIDAAMIAPRSQEGLWSLLAEEAPLWPTGWYTIDVLEGFTQMDSMSKMKKTPSIEECFEAVFQTPWRKSTYYDARRRLKKLHQCDIDVSVAASRSKAGLWSLLAKEAPL